MRCPLPSPCPEGPRKEGSPSFLGPWLIVTNTAPSFRRHFLRTLRSPPPPHLPLFYLSLPSPLSPPFPTPLSPLFASQSFRRSQVPHKIEVKIGYVTPCERGSGREGGGKGGAIDADKGAWPRGCSRWRWCKWYLDGRLGSMVCLTRAYKILFSYIY